MPPSGTDSSNLLYKSSKLPPANWPKAQSNTSVSTLCKFKSGIKCLRTSLRTSPAVSSHRANAYQRAYGTQVEAPAELLIGSKSSYMLLCLLTLIARCVCTCPAHRYPCPSPHNWQCLSQYCQKEAPSKAPSVRCHDQTQTFNQSHLADRSPNPKVTNLWQGPTEAMSSLSRVSLSS